MDTEKRFGLKKSAAYLLFIQMALTLVVLVAAVYLLIFVLVHNLGGWMAVSYVMVIISLLAIIGHGLFGYKIGPTSFKITIAAFLIATFINMLLPGRETFQIAGLSLLFALTLVFLFKQNDRKEGSIFACLMGAVALVLSIYSAIKANPQFLGPVSENWLTYVAMYISIFIPTVMTSTIAIVFHVNLGKKQL
ncbi:MAG: hypothetical protein J6328_03790 [Bacilli bacterium]|nr:hypothetical protein [Bacilli bacterium]